MAQRSQFSLGSFWGAREKAFFAEYAMGVWGMVASNTQANLFLDSLGFFKNSHVHSPQFREVHQLLQGLGVESMYRNPLVHHRAKWRHRRLRERILGWLADFENLEEFPHFYLTYGITDGIHHWLLNENRPIQVFSGEYQWLDILGKVSHKADSLSELRKDAVLYCSNPRSCDGNFAEDWEAIQESRVPIILDCAYFGTAPARRMKLSASVEQVFFSLSKPFGLNLHRCGFVFSRQEIPSLKNLLEAGYYSGQNAEILWEVAGAFSPYLSFNSLLEPQTEACNALSLTSSDSVLLATSTSSDFARFRRESGHNRICLTGLYEKAGLDFLIPQFFRNEETPPHPG